MTVREPFKKLATQVMKSADQVFIEADGSQYYSYSLNDLTVIFEKESKKFFSLSFETLGMIFTYTQNEITVENPADPEEVVSLTNQLFIKQLESYIEWRSQVLESSDL